MTIQLVKQHATRIANGNARVQPGQPLELNAAAAEHDLIWQGDFGVEVVSVIPPNYRDADSIKQLVPGNTVGSRHVLADTSTVSDFMLPDGWTSDASYDGQWGPLFRAKEETVIEHPTHGDVTIAKGHLIRCRYQRNWDAQKKRERRTLD